eukprot:363624-Chlamydomonas_euryale.AAC.4
MLQPPSDRPHAGQTAVQGQQVRPRRWLRRPQHCPHTDVAGYLGGCRPADSTGGLPCATGDRQALLALPAQARSKGAHAPSGCTVTGRPDDRLLHLLAGHSGGKGRGGRRPARARGGRRRQGGT